MRFLILIGTLALTACAPIQGGEVARDAAKSVVRPVVADQFPGFAVEPSVDCIIDNATPRELFALASDAVTGPTAATAETVAGIASRPETLSCLTTSGLSALRT